MNLEHSTWRMSGSEIKPRRILGCGVHVTKVRKSPLPEFRPFSYGNRISQENNHPVFRVLWRVAVRGVIEVGKRLNPREEIGVGSAIVDIQNQSCHGFNVFRRSGRSLFEESRDDRRTVLVSAFLMLRNSSDEPRYDVFVRSRDVIPTTVDTAVLENDLIEIRHCRLQRRWLLDSLVVFV